MEGALAPLMSLGDGIGHGLSKKAVKSTITLLRAASAFPFLGMECVVSNMCYFCLEGFVLLLE